MLENSIGLKCEIIDDTKIYVEYISIHETIDHCKRKKHHFGTKKT